MSDKDIFTDIEIKELEAKQELKFIKLFIRIILFIVIISSIIAIIHTIVRFI